MSPTAGPVPQAGTGRSEPPVPPATGGQAATGAASSGTVPSGAAQASPSGVGPGEGPALTHRGTLVRVVETWGTVITLEVALAPGAGPGEARGSGGPDPGLVAAVSATMDACQEDMARIDHLFSTYRDDSVVSALRTGRRTEADLDLADPDDALVISVLDQCRRLRATTGGAFDPWAVRGGLDPSAYVKGWGTGRFADLLWHRIGPGTARHRGAAGVRGAVSIPAVRGVCVNAGGDVSVRGSQADGSAWSVGVRDPRDPGTILRVVEARGGHVATSGLYERGGHLTATGSADPGGQVAGRTGLGHRPAAPPGRADGRVLSATVWGPDDGTADALATAFFLDGRLGADWMGHVMDADTGGGRTVSRWGAYVVQEDGAWRLGATDALT